MFSWVSNTTHFHISKIMNVNQDLKESSMNSKNAVVEEITFIL